MMRAGFAAGSEMKTIHYVGIAAGAAVVAAAIVGSDWISDPGWGVPQSYAQSTNPPARRPAPKAPAASPTPAPPQAQAQGAPAPSATQRTDAPCTMPGP